MTASEMVKQLRENKESFEHFDKWQTEVVLQAITELDDRLKALETKESE